MSKRQYNKWRRRQDGTVEVILTQGQVALVDEGDWSKVQPYKWCALHTGTCWYAVTNVLVASNKWARLRMHRVILDAPDDKFVDHINRNGLDNRRCNLRLATHAQNMANQAARSGTSSQYKGVYKITNRLLRKPWRAYCGRKKLGCFATEHGAALAYNSAAKTKWGEFALLNDVE